MKTKKGEREEKKTRHPAWRGEPDRGERAETVGASSGGWQTQEGSKRRGHSKQSDIHAGSRMRTSIACQALTPGESPMRTLSPGKMGSRGGGISQRGRLNANIYALAP